MEAVSPHGEPRQEVRVVGYGWLAGWLAAIAVLIVAVVMTFVVEIGAVVGGVIVAVAAIVAARACCMYVTVTPDEVIVRRWWRTGRVPLNEVVSVDIYPYDGVFAPDRMPDFWSPFDFVYTPNLVLTTEGIRPLLWRLPAEATADDVWAMPLLGLTGQPFGADKRAKALRQALASFGNTLDGPLAEERLGDDWVEIDGFLSIPGPSAPNGENFEEPSAARSSENEKRSFWSVLLFAGLRPAIGLVVAAVGLGLFLPRTVYEVVTQAAVSQLAREGQYAAITKCEVSSTDTRVTIEGVSRPVVLSYSPIPLLSRLSTNPVWEPCDADEASPLAAGVVYRVEADGTITAVSVSSLEVPWFGVVLFGLVAAYAGWFLVFWSLFYRAAIRGRK